MNTSNTSILEEKRREGRKDRREGECRKWGGGGRREPGEGRREPGEGRRGGEGKGEYTHCCPIHSELRILRHIKIISNEINC